MRLSDDDNSEQTTYSVAETAKGGVVVVMFDEDRESRSWTKFLAYPSWEAAAANAEARVAVREAVRRRGVPVEELDI